MKYSHVSREKKIKSFEALQTQPSPLPSEKAATTHNLSQTILNIFLNIFIYFYLFIFFICEALRVVAAFSEGRGEGCVWRTSKDLIFFF